MKKNITAAVLLGLAAGLYPMNFTEAVQAVPEPGQDIRPVQEEQKARETPKLDNQLGEAPTKAPEELRFTMREIRVEQPESKPFKQEKLDAIAAKGAGHEITVADLDKVLAELSAYARRHGYPACYAYVPEQKAVRGVLIVRMALGIYDEIVVENTTLPGSTMPGGSGTKKTPAKTACPRAGSGSWWARAGNAQKKSHSCGSGSFLAVQMKDKTSNSACPSFICLGPLDNFIFWGVE